MRVVKKVVRPLLLRDEKLLSEILATKNITWYQNFSIHTYKTTTWIHLHCNTVTVGINDFHPILLGNENYRSGFRKISR